MSDNDGEDPSLFRELREAIRRTPHPVVEIEAGIPLSIALGRARPAVACGGCAVPLSFEGIPAITVPGLDRPFRLRTAGTSGAPA
ncbi:MAG: hypothetical protein ACREC5_06380 [Thermoplasmata archaeon]